MRKIFYISLKKKLSSHIVVAGVISALLAVLLLPMLFTDGPASLNKKPSCEKVMTDGYAACAESVDTRYQNCMSRAKVLFNESDRAAGTSQCKRKAVLEITTCKWEHTVCADEKTD
jgi:hypothetical protein